MVSGINQAIHFLFDDYDFGESDIGATLLADREVFLIAALKRELDPIIDDLPRGDDDDYVSHPRWPQVTAAALAARNEIT